MALEPNFRYLDDLVPANPAFNDPVNQGDDHLRGIKSALLANVTGDASETRLLADGAMTARIRAGQLALFPTSDANDAVLTIRTADDSIARAFINAGGSSTGPGLRVANRQPGGEIIFQGRNAADSSSFNMATLLPDGAVKAAYAGVEVVETTASGLKAAATGQNTALEAITSTSVNEARLIAANARGGVILLADGTGDFVRLGQTNASGTYEKFWQRLTRDGGIQFFHNNSEVLATRADGIAVGGAASSVLTMLRNGNNYIDLSGGTAATLRVRNSGGADCFYLDTDSFTRLYHDAVRALDTADPSVYSTSVRIIHDDGNPYPAGINTMPPVSIAANTTVGLVHSGKLINMNSSITRVFTLPATLIGEGGFTCAIAVPLAGTARITPDAGATLTWLDGGSGPQGTRDVTKGVATLYQRSATDWWIWGSGII